MRPSKSRSEQGSSPLELVLLTTVLLIPVVPAIALYQQLSDELAAESIARHSLRLAILEAEAEPVGNLSRAIEKFATSWGKEVTNYGYWCSVGCSLANLEIQIGRATALHTMGLAE